MLKAFYLFSLLWWFRDFNDLQKEKGLTLRGISYQA